MKENTFPSYERGELLYLAATGGYGCSWGMKKGLDGTVVWFQFIGFNTIHLLLWLWWVGQFIAKLPHLQKCSANWCIFALVCSIFSEVILGTQQLSFTFIFLPISIKQLSNKTKTNITCNIRSPVTNRKCWLNQFIIFPMKYLKQRNFLPPAFYTTECLVTQFDVQKSKEKCRRQITFTIHHWAWLKSFMTVAFKTANHISACTISTRVANWTFISICT